MRNGRRFGWCLAAIVIAALAVRCGYIAGAKRGPCPLRFGDFVVGQVHSECLGGDGFVNDQYWYNVTADEVAHGQFFRDGLTHAPKADHPPLTVFVLAGTSFAFNHLPLSSLSESPATIAGPRFVSHVREQRYTIAAIGALVVLLIGLLGRRVGGDSVGLLAATLAAVYPNMWVNDGLLFGEPIARACVLGALLVALRTRTRASARSFLLLGALCGLAALARSELLVLLPALAIAAAWHLRREGLRPVLVAMLAASAGATLVVAPWIAFNMTRFKEPVFIATNDGVTLAGANCDFGYRGSTIGLWKTGAPCTYTAEESAKLGDQSQLDHAYRTKAFTYIGAHAGRVPVVVAARIGRTWGLYRPLDMIGYEVNENKERWVSWAGVLTFYPVFIAAIAGAVVLFRRRQRYDLAVICMPLLTTTLVVAFLSYGQVRHRAVAEPSLTILAAVAARAFAGRRLRLASE